VAFTPDGKRVAAGGTRRPWGQVNIWDIKTGQQIRHIETGVREEICGLAFSPDGRRLSTFSHGDSRLRVWDAETGKQVGAFTCDSRTGYGNVCYSPDDRSLAAPSRDSPQLWDASDVERPRTLRGHKAQVESVAWSPDGRLLASAGDEPSIKIWDPATGQDIRTLVGHTKDVNRLAFCGDGRRLASASNDGTAIIWDVSTGKKLQVLHGHQVATDKSAPRVFGVAFSPDETLVATASPDRTVKLWDLSNGQCLRTFTGHADTVHNVAFSPDGQVIASASNDRTVKLWDVKTGLELRTLTGHSHWVYCVSFSPDGRLLASGSEDRTLRVWNFVTGDEVGRLRGHAECIYSLAFSPDGNRLATASTDHSIKIWEVQTGQELLALKGHAARVNSAAFSPDGHWLASCSEDQTVKLWDARPQTPDVTRDRDALGLARFLVGRPLTKADAAEFIRTDDTVSEDVRAGAQKWLERFREEIEPNRYHDAARALVRNPYLNSFHRRLALRQAQAACRLAPDEIFYLVTLGVAQYRMSQYHEALATLNRCEKASTGSTTLLAFLAMAHHQLGHRDLAKSFMDRLHQLTKDPRWVKDDETQDFLREAEQLIEKK
jgi:WD40 repeat protein